MGCEWASHFTVWAELHRADFGPGLTPAHGSQIAPKQQVCRAHRYGQFLILSIHAFSPLRYIPLIPIPDQVLFGCLMWVRREEEDGARVNKIALICKELLIS